MRSGTRKKTGKNKLYLEWMHTQVCFVTGRRPVTVHHVRFCGGPRIDTRTLPLIAELHMLGHEKYAEFGPCIERGKKVFEQAHGVDIEAGIKHYQDLFTIECGAFDTEN